MRAAIRNIILNAPVKPSFELALKTSLVPERAVAGTPTFTRSSTATCWGYLEADNSGAAQTLLTIPSGIPRFEGARFIASNNTWSRYFADGAAIPDATLHGYVAEGSRTNLSLQSESFDSASWTKENASITANSVISPSGNLTADTITNNTTNGLHRVYLTVNPSASKTLTVYAKQGTAAFIGLSPTGLEISSAVFDLSNGTIPLSGANVTSSITNVGNGWYRCSVTEITILGHFLLINFGETAAQAWPDASYVGTTKTLYLWGAQAEQAQFASSYIPTTTAAVTRAADALKYPTAGNFSDTAGSAYAETIATSWANATGQYLGDGTNSPLQASASNRGIQVYDGTNTANGPTGTPSGQMKVASSWTGSTIKALSTGAMGTAGTYDGAFTLAQLNIGSSYFGTVRNVRIFKRALRDSQLIGITS